MERPIGSEFEIEIRLKLMVVEDASGDGCNNCIFAGFTNCPWSVIGKCAWEREDTRIVIFKEVSLETKLIEQ